MASKKKVQFAAELPKDEADLNKLDQEMMRLRLSKPISLELESAPLTSQKADHEALITVLDGLTS